MQLFLFILNGCFQICGFWLRQKKNKTLDPIPPDGDIKMELFDQREGHYWWTVNWILAWENTTRRWYVYAESNYSKCIFKVQFTGTTSILLGKELTEWKWKSESKQKWKLNENYSIQRRRFKLIFFLFTIKSNLIFS